MGTDSMCQIEPNRFAVGNNERPIDFCMRRHVPSIALPQVSGRPPVRARRLCPRAGFAPSLLPCGSVNRWSLTPSRSLAREPHMTPLRRRMIEDMNLPNLRHAPSSPASNASLASHAILNRRPSPSALKRSPPAPMNNPRRLLPARTRAQVGSVSSQRARSLSTALPDQSWLWLCRKRHRMI
jgi:hypothetical protein